MRKRQVVKGRKFFLSEKVSLAKLLSGVLDSAAVHGPRFSGPETAENCFIAP